jgi:hypothetical protein
VSAASEKAEAEKIVQIKAPFDKVKYFKFKLESFGAVLNGKKSKCFIGEFSKFCTATMKR